KCIDKARETDDTIYICGFKAEYKVSKEELIDRTRKKLREAKANLMVANDVGREKRGFKSETNEVFIVNNENVVHLPLETKREIAIKILDQIIKDLKAKNSPI
ncbi:MAG: bifunctional phosphopantothenoylcysteine decarboxylase/phosphopantothenate synthase, partial [Candidatus Lokiarchaeota archaeon]|nr:bifunctional phosphopantothenoylcysteine decarboxylase/phosphopantothenate synthase [Candidatus Lokiarchaeota archaeon]